jgi:sugar lactone lactonase YvrE
VDAGGNLLVTDYSNGEVRKVDPSGTISTLAAGIIHPSGIAIGPDGTVYVSSRDRAGSSSVVKLKSNGGTVPIAGGLATPGDVAVDVAGNVYVADVGQARVFRIDPAGTMTTFAGNGQFVFSGDGGPATAASLNEPYGLAIDGVGNVYISEYGHERVRRVDPTGTISTVAGNGTTGFGGDGGPATAASLNTPLFVAIDSTGRLYIADSKNSRVRRVDGNGVITTVVGAGTYGHSGDGGAAIDAHFRSIGGIAFDASDNLFLADSSNGCVRRVEH